MTLALLYSFVPRTSPIHASAPGATNLVTIDVTIINPDAGQTTPSGVSIEIPVGGTSPDDPTRLSARTPLPDPCGIPSASGWAFEVDDSTILLTPPAAITEELRFTLADIAVNNASTTVPIIISESSPVVTDGTSYCLFRVPHGCAITSFWAQPATLETVDFPFRLKWSGDADAETYAYRVYADGWSAPAAGEYYAYADSSSATGVPGPALIFDTDIALDIFEKQAGKMVAIGTAVIRVTIDEPRFSAQVSLARVAGLGGFVACMNWEARNASSCRLTASGRVVTDDAPPDTSGLHAGTPFPGYLATIGDDSADSVLEVSAPAPTPKGYPALYVPQLLGVLPGLEASKTIAVPVSGTPVSMQYSGHTASLVTQDASGDRSLSLVRFDTDDAWGVSSGMRFGPALSPDGRWALGPADTSWALGYYSVPNQAASGPLPLPQFSTVLGSGFSGDGTHVYVSGYEVGGALVTLAATVGDWQFQAVDTTPSGLEPGRLISVCFGYEPQGYWMLIAPATAGQPLHFVGYEAQALAATPDGTLMVMATGDQELRRFDITAGNEGPPVPLSVMPSGVALSGDGRFAAVASQSANKVVFVDVGAGVEIPGALDAAGPIGVGLGEDGSLAVFESSPPQVRRWSSPVIRHTR